MRELIVAAVIMVALALSIAAAYAKPVAVNTQQAGVTILLTDEKCVLQTISNLPNRATWNEAGKTFEGCWTVRPDTGVVLIYFEDMSVVAVPVRSFREVTEL